MSVLLLLMGCGLFYLVVVRQRKQKVDKHKKEEKRTLTPDETNAYKRQITGELDEVQSTKKKTNWEHD